MPRYKVSCPGHPEKTVEAEQRGHAVSEYMRELDLPVLPAQPVVEELTGDAGDDDGGGRSPPLPMPGGR